MYRHLTWGATPTGRPPGPGRDHRRRWPRARRRSRRWRPAPPSGRAWVGRVGGVGKGWAWGGQIRGIGASGPPGRPRRSLPPAVLCAARRLLPSARRQGSALCHRRAGALNLRPHGLSSSLFMEAPPVCIYIYIHTGDHQRHSTAEPGVAQVWWRASAPATTTLAEARGPVPRPLLGPWAV